MDPAMAQRHVIQLIDDLDQTLIDEGGATHTFAIDGRSYEIDLSAENAEKLRESLAPFVAVARRSARDATPTSRKRSRSKGETDAIRAWARDHGYEVNDRGRISESVIAAYRRTAS